MIDTFGGKYWFLNNSSPSWIIYNSIKFPTVQHAFQAQKSISLKLQRRIARLLTAKEARTYGQHIQLRDDWKSVKIHVMKNLIYEKFKDSDLSAFLIATGNEEIIHGNDHHDNFWGSCCCGVCKPGKNKLGKIIMRERRYFTSGEYLTKNKKKPWVKK